MLPPFHFAHAAAMPLFAFMLMTPCRCRRCRQIFRYYAMRLFLALPVAADIILRRAARHARFSWPCQYADTRHHALPPLIMMPPLRSADVWRHALDAAMPAPLYASARCYLPMRDATRCCCRQALLLMLTRDADIAPCHITLPPY